MTHPTRATVSISEDGVVFSEGARHIFRAVDSRREIRRFVSDGTLPRCPQPGECWDLDFVADNYLSAPSAAVESQFRVTAGRLLNATGSYVIGLLSYHPALRGLGIGPRTAAALYSRHGERLVDLLNRGEFKSVECISEETAWDLCERWRAIAIEPEVIKWFDQHNLPTRLAARIHHLYGAECVVMLESNPYCLHAFMSFGEVDALATLRLGISPEHPNRLIAATENVLYRAMDRGHTAVRHAVLVQALRATFGDNAPQALELSIARQCAVARAGYVQAIAPALMEQFIEKWIADSGDGQQVELEMLDGSVEHRLAALAVAAGIDLNQEQQAAVLGAFRARAFLICGGAGVGKTTVLRHLAQLIIAAHGTAVFMAVAGRAARRIAESLGAEVSSKCRISTVAAFLHAQRTPETRLPSDSSPWLIIDEASMLDLHSAYWLLAKAPKNARLILVGDPGQLPPVGCGLVFHRMVDSGAVPKVELTRVYRQAASTGIPGAARSVREGILPPFPDFTGIGTGVQLHVAPMARAVADAIEIADALAAGGTVQVLTLFKNACGAKAVNTAKHESLPKQIRRLTSVPLDFAEGEPVIFKRNAPDLDLQNGSMGRVSAIHNESKAMSVRWDDGREMEIKGLALWDCDLAYGITTHKSQGSQFDRVVIVVPRPSAILDRCLIYTAITRARIQAVLVGDADAIRNAVERPSTASIREVRKRPAGVPGLRY